MPAVACTRGGGQIAHRPFSIRAHTYTADTAIDTFLGKKNTPRTFPPPLTNRVYAATVAGYSRRAVRISGIGTEAMFKFDVLRAFIIYYSSVKVLVFFRTAAIR